MRLLLALMFLPLAGFGQQELPDPLQAGWKGEKVCKVLVENESVRTLVAPFPQELVMKSTTILNTLAIPSREALSALQMSKELEK